jgi:hypothetical protein
MVNVRLINKLSNAPPSANLVLSYMKEIAKEYKIDWEPAEVGIPEGSQAFTTPTGFSIPMAPGTELRSVYQRHSAAPEEDRPIVMATTTSTAAPTAAAAASLPPPPTYSEIAAIQRSHQKQQPESAVPPSIYHHEDIPMATATIIADDDHRQHEQPSQPAMPMPTLPSPPVEATSSRQDDDSFAALQARLAALRDL